MQIDRHRFLVVRLGEPRQRVATTGGRAEIAAGVATHGVLDLQDLGTKLAENRGAIWRRDDGRDVNTPNATQRKVIRLVRDFAGNVPELAGIMRELARVSPILAHTG